MTLAAHAVRLEERLERVERRLEDVEDAVHAALDPAGLEALGARLDELAVSAVTSDELLEVRLHSARVATELDRVAALVEPDHVSWRATA